MIKKETIKTIFVFFATFVVIFVVMLAMYFGYHFAKEKLNQPKLPEIHECEHPLC